MNSLTDVALSVNVSSQGHLLTVGVAGRRAGAGGRRGTVNAFSAASRRRLIKLFASLDVSVKSGVFLTLTYPNEFPSPVVAKRDLRAFLERVRRAFPAASAVWRLEFQRRGAPHFHVVLFNFPFVDKEKIQSMWGEIIGCEKPFTRIEWIRSRRGLMSYVSKYVAKTSSSGFNLLAYLHGDEFIHPQTGELCGSVGRWWGVFNGDRLPLGVLAEVQIKAFPAAAFYQFRRAARRRFRGISKRQLQGFFLVSDDVDAWMSYWYHCLLSFG